MKDKASDVHLKLMAQLERLDDETLSTEQLDAEIRRAKAMADVAKVVVANKRLVLDAVKMVAKGSIRPEQLPGYVEAMPQIANGQ